VVLQQARQSLNLVVCLFIACSIGKTRLESLSRAIVPFLMASITVLLICTYWADLVMLIPRWFGYVVR
jgi:C4-dicarboxylate transporter DctM subunit